MPPAHGRSSRSEPIASPSIRRAASSNETSVKTAIAKRKGGRSEMEDVPDALAGGAARGVHTGRKVTRAVAGDDLVARRTVLRGDGHLLQLAAHAQLLDVVALVVDHRALDEGLVGELLVDGRCLELDLAARRRRDGIGGSRARGRPRRPGG